MDLEFTIQNTGQWAKRNTWFPSTEARGEGALPLILTEPALHDIMASAVNKILTVDLSMRVVVAGAASHPSPMGKSPFLPSEPKGKSTKPNREGCCGVSCTVNTCIERRLLQNSGNTLPKGGQSGKPECGFYLGQSMKERMDGNLEELCKLWDGSHSVLGQSPPL